MASLVDSAAAFALRPLRLAEVGLEPSVKHALEKQDSNGFAKLAFASSTQPGQIYEDKLAVLLKICFGPKDVTLGLQSQL